LDDVAGHAGRIRAGADFCAASAEGFQLPVVQRGSLHRHVITGIAVLAFRDGLDDLRAGQFVGDLGEIEGVAAGWVIPGKCQRADGVEKIAAGPVGVVGQKRNGDGHFDLRRRIGHEGTETEKCIQRESSAVRR
jgi:hypothetical protein